MLNSGDTGFMMIATAFVFFMTPGLAFFYGGLVRRKNVLNTMISSFFRTGPACACRELQPGATRRSFS